MSTTCSLVLGSFINGYSIIKELYEKGLRDIILFDTRKRLAAYSNKITQFVLIHSSTEALLEAIEQLHFQYERIVIYPTSESQLEQLHELSEHLSSYCFLPFNQANLLDCMDKIYQYRHCEKVGVPYPKSVYLEQASDLPAVLTLSFPVIIKPSKHYPAGLHVFRNLIVETHEEYKLHQLRLAGYLQSGVRFLVSEVVPGDSSNVYAYVGYRSRAGVILNEWMGKKLSQYPDNFGVFASASNQAPLAVLEQGRKLLETMDLYGICEPEFRYDPRDGLYKLMEINLRAMMWNRVGKLSGVDILYTQYLDAIGEQGVKQVQNQDQEYHFVYFKHEFLGLVNGTIRWGTFWRNLFRADRTYYAVFEWRDVKPFLYDTWITCKGLFRRVTKAFRLW